MNEFTRKGKERTLGKKILSIMVEGLKNSSDAKMSACPLLVAVKEDYYKEVIHRVNNSPGTIVIEPTGLGFSILLQVVQDELGLGMIYLVEKPSTKTVSKKPNVLIGPYPGNIVS